ncbi:hypothetical protein BJ322DRAFT_1019819 [Thelephora terrestris]|uniref:Uncharacterized protein n=1 Tax=Thelephora terrestris TaxID=56493 RepID=A0A9P6HI05_9AGAM|nr:hypothetical protein BJ322DRAFT_1019819 [Thelephora terrestris]
MSDFTSSDLDSKSIVVFNPIGSADHSGDHPGGQPAPANAGAEHHVEQHTGPIAGEPINCSGSINAAVNQASQTVLVNIQPSDSPARRTVLSFPRGFLPFSVTRESSATSFTLRAVVRKSLLRRLFYLFLAVLIAFVYIVFVLTWHVVHPAGIKCYTTYLPTVGVPTERIFQILPPYGRSYFERGDHVNLPFLDIKSFFRNSRLVYGAGAWSFSVPYLDPAPPRSASGFVRITLPWSSGYVQQNLGVTPQSFYNSPPLRYRRRFYSSGGERCEVLLMAHYQLGKAVIPLKNHLHIEETAHQLLSCDGSVSDNGVMRIITGSPPAFGPVVAAICSDLLLLSF